MQCMRCIHGVYGTASKGTAPFTGISHQQCTAWRMAATTATNYNSGFMDEVQLTWDGITNTRNSHSWAEETHTRLHNAILNNALQKFSVKRNAFLFRVRTSCDVRTHAVTSRRGNSKFRQRCNDIFERKE